MPSYYWLVLLLTSTAVWIYDSKNGNQWKWDAYAIGLFLMLWIQSLKKSPASPLLSQNEPSEPAFDPDVRPQGTFEQAILTGTDADFTYFVHEDFPFTDWKGPVEEDMEQFEQAIPALKYSVDRDLHTGLATVHLELGAKKISIELPAGPEGCALTEPLATFFWPEYILCSYRYTEGSDTWLNPVFSRELWDRIVGERPDRAALFTPVVEYHVGKKGPRR